MVNVGAEDRLITLQPADRDLKMAVAHNRLLQFTYNGAFRIVEPHVYGMQHGALRLLAYQLRGAGKLASHPGWRMFDVLKIDDLMVSTGTFPPRHQSHRHHGRWDRILAKVT